MSKAIALRNAALRLASREGPDLVLTEPKELARAVISSIRNAVSESRSILLLGLSTPGIAADLISSLEGKSLTVADPDPTLSPALLASSARRPGSCIRLAADATDLRVDPQISDQLVAEIKPLDYAGYKKVADRIAQRSALNPLVPDASADLVLIDCMANRLAEAEAARMHSEAFRVLRRGGRMMEICLLADEPLPSEASVDMGSWQGVRFPLEARAALELEAAGFHGMAYNQVLTRPLRICQGTELR